MFETKIPRKQDLPSGRTRAKIFAFALLIAGAIGILKVFAFTGPNSPPGSGSGALGVNSSNNLSVGADLGPEPETKFLIVASSTDSSNFALKVTQWGSGNPIFVVRNDGAVGVGTSTPDSATLTVQGNLYTTGAFTGTIAASNVTADVFASGNFAFPSSVGIATTTQVGLPQQLSVYGNAFVSGNVGIQNENPTTLLSVGNSTSGLVAIFGGGTGKINVGTVDPIYTIGGKKYATYLPGMTGQKEETTGVVFIIGSKEQAVLSYAIDFNKVEEGSDLWLFSKVAALKNNFDKLAVLLTPSFDGRVWYEKDAAKYTLTIFGVPNSRNSALDSLEVSYRFSAPRFDADRWKNATDDPSEGFIIEE